MNYSKKKTIKSMLLMIAFTMTLTVFSPLITETAKAAEVQTEQEFYKEQVSENPNFSNDLAKVKLQLASSKTSTSGQVTTQGVVGGTLKAIKALSPILRHGGTALSWALKPFSKKTAVVVKRNSRKAANAIDKLDKGTRGALENALVKAGVPRSDAKTIVYWVFMII
ncbi:hypothetical protein [Priestia endophytica]|uniref:hypothetical protein n=1 Tax=Priestia endophytica TaxID=135735 RepID=UPI000DCA3775|nr:hypothetical protein [Priestia endophytica]RAS77950.1 hypothetical protein A4U60_17770 [Priestia endophytica]